MLLTFLKCHDLKLERKMSHLSQIKYKIRKKVVPSFYCNNYNKNVINCFIVLIGFEMLFFESFASNGETNLLR